MGNRQSISPPGFYELNRRESRRPKNKIVMDRLRKSFRESFRKKKDHIPESSKPHQWQADEQAVRSGNCVFPVKYLGCVEVFESRGMQICEEALRLLRNSKRRPIKGNLFITGDGLRVVDENTKGLIVDQTIEKVSFCAPDRNHERGFSYICRDGTTRRWMCHGFHAIKDSGERLSHAVGCAFTVCLERKQKRDKEAVTASFDSKTSTFTRTGSFRQTSITERLTDPQECKPAEPPPVKPVHNPYAIQRPHATPQLLQRQGSFRALSELNQTSSPFKRQLSLRLNELPSNLERQRAHSLESSNLYELNNGTVPPIPEVSPIAEKDSIKALCEEVSQGLSLLSKTDDPFILASHLTSADFTKQDNRSNSSNTGSTTLLNSTVPPKEILKLYSTSPVPAPSPAVLTSGSDSLSSTFATITPLAAPVAPVRKCSPKLSQLRTQSLESSDAFIYNNLPNKQPNSTNVWSIKREKVSNTELVSSTQKKNEFDPFDAEWVAVGPRNKNDVSGAGSIKSNTNPFAQVSSTVKAFEVKM